MKYNKNVLFTTNYGLNYEGWQKLDLPVEEQYWSIYLWCNNYVYTRASNYYLFVQITDNKDNVLFEGEIATIDHWEKIKKNILKCKSSKCTEQDIVYIVDENFVYICDENNNFIIE